MNPLPPQERLAIYRKVLEEVPVKKHVGLCYLLYGYCPRDFNKRGSMFPEYEQSECKHVRKHSDFWFPLSDRASRIAIVEGWIKQVEEELTNQPQG